MPHHSSSDSDIWTFNLNDYAGFDSQSDDNEQGSSAKDHIGSDFQLMKTFDLSSREDTAKYVPNPWAIAKANAACRGIVKNSVEETSTPKTKNGSSDTILASAANTSEHPLPGTKVSLNTPKGVHSHGRSEAENISRRTPASNTTKQRSIPARKPICPFHVRSSNRTPVTPIITSTASFERSSVPAIRNSAHKNPLTAHDLSNAVDVSPMLAEPDKQSPTLALYNTRLDTGVIPATPVGPRSTHRTRRMPLRAFHTPRSATISDDLSFVHPENRRGLYMRYISKSPGFIFKYLVLIYHYSIGRQVQKSMKKIDALRHLRVLRQKHCPRMLCPLQGKKMNHLDLYLAL